MKKRISLISIAILPVIFVFGLILFQLEGTYSKFSTFENREQLKGFLDSELHNGANRKKFEEVVIEPNFSFQTVEYYLDDDLKTSARRDGENYLIVYYIIDYQKTSKEGWPWRGPPGWEIWSTFSPDDKLISYKVKRNFGKSGVVQHTYLPESVDFSFMSFGADRESLYKRLSMTLKAGTGRDAVQGILVEQAGAVEQRLSDEMSAYNHPVENPPKFYHSCPAEMNWTVKVFFDGEDRLKKFTLRGPC